jgi:hypothetical protein
MPMEANINALWFGGQDEKGTENTAPIHRGKWVGGDLTLARDDGSEAWSDLTKYGGNTDWVNSQQGNGNPAIEAAPSNTGAMGWLAHGAEEFTTGVNNVWTIAGMPTAGQYTLVIWDCNQEIPVPGVLNTMTAAALATAVNTAMATAGYGATSVVGAGGPLNTTPITLTFSGGAAAHKPFYLSKIEDTTAPAATLTATVPAVRGSHLFTPQLALPHWATFVKHIGSSVVQREAYVDGLIGGLTLESTTANKASRLTPTILFLDPANVRDTDPAAEIATGIDGKPFIYTDGAGTHNIDGLVQRGVSQMTFTTNEDRTPVPGDDVVFYDFATGTPTVTLGTTMVFDDAGRRQYNRGVYGVEEPAAGTKPLKNIPALGSYGFHIKQKDSRGLLTGNELRLSIGGVKWAIPTAPAASQQGGPTEIALAGSMRPLGGDSPPYELEIINGDGAYTA